jgi:hypothetical protein
MSPGDVRRRRTLAAVGLVVLIVGVPVGVWAWGRSSRTFDVRHIVLTGAYDAHARAVRGALDRHLLGVNLFRVNTALVRTALAAFPYVADVTIDRDFPDTLKVRMTEYAPSALVLASDGWFVVAAGGRVLAAGVEPPGAPTPSSTALAAGASPSPGATPVVDRSPAVGGSPSPDSSSVARASPSPSPSVTALPRPDGGVKLPRGTRDLPVVVTTARLAVGATISDPHTLAALLVLDALPHVLRHRVLGATASDTSIRVTISDGLLVEFGDATRLRAKVLALTAVLARYRAQRVVCTYVDVSVPDRPLGAPLLRAPATQSSAAATPQAGATGGPPATPRATPTGKPSASPTSRP